MLDDDDKNDDSSSVSSVNAVNGVDYFGEEERRMSGGDDDVSTQGKSDEATHAKFIYLDAGATVTEWEPTVCITSD